VARRNNYFVSSFYAVWIIAWAFWYYGAQLLFESGHGTYVENEEVVASVAGTIERVNKLITVRAIRTKYILLYLKVQLLRLMLVRYNPEVGDLVVGRITEVNITTTRRNFVLSFLGAAASMEGRRQFASRRRPHAVISKSTRWCAGMYILRRARYPLTIILAPKTGKR
jgi:hypothetical protein